MALGGSNITVLKAAPPFNIKEEHLGDFICDIQQLEEQSIPHPNS
jgi:hypothetical protein